MDLQRRFVRHFCPAGEKNLLVSLAGKNLLVSLAGKNLLVSLAGKNLVFGVVALALSACGSQLSEATHAEAERAHVEAAGRLEPSEATPRESPSEAAPTEAEEAPALTLFVTNDDRHVTLVLQNRGRANVRFSSSVLLETIEASPTTERLPLHLDEARPLPICAELAPGALLELDTTPSAGAHRFVLTSCDGSARTESERFTL